jgi:hypothetical protein
MVTQTSSRGHISDEADQLVRQPGVISEHTFEITFFGHDIEALFVHVWLVEGNDGPSL